MKRLISILFLIVLSTGWCCSQSINDEKVDSLVALLPYQDTDEGRLKILSTIAMKCMSVDTTYKYALMEQEVAERVGSVEYIAESYYLQGWCFYYHSNITEAEALFKKALEVSDGTIDDVKRALFFRELAYCYHAIKNYNSAIDACYEAYDRYALIDNKKQMSHCYRLMASICSDYQIFEYANDFVSKAYSIDTAQGFVDLEAQAQDFMCWGLSSFLKYKTVDHNPELLSIALECYRKGDSLLDCVQDDFGKSELYLGFADAMVALANLDTTGTEYRNMYADSACYYAQLGMELARKYGIDDNWMHLYMIETKAMLLKHSADSLADRFGFISSRFDFKADYEDIYGERYYDLLSDYYYQVGEYEMAFDFVSRLRSYRYKRYKNDISTKLNYLVAKDNFYKMKEALVLSKEERDKAFLAETERNRTLNNWLLYIGIGVGAVCLAIYLSALLFQRVNATIKKQNSDIGQQNKDLTSQKEEFLQLKREYEDERHDLERQKTKFRKANRSIIISCTQARQIQTVLMPSRSMMNNIFGDCLIYWKPLQTVSGDFYWATQVRDVRVLVSADCTGHGVPGAFMSMLGISSLNNIVSSRNVNSSEFSAAFVIDQMRSKVIKSLRQNIDDSEQYDSMDMSVVITRLGDTRIEYAGANRPLMIAGADGVREFQPDDMPAGLDMNASAPFTNHVIYCNRGDVVYMYSDGITDQFGGKNGRTKFGDRRLRDLLGRIYPMSFADQYMAIRESDAEWTTIKCAPDDGVEELYTPQLDDQLLIGIRIG